MDNMCTVQIPHANLGQHWWNLWWTKWHWDRFLDAFVQSRKTPINFVMTVHLPVRKQQRESNWTDCNEIWCWGLYENLPKNSKSSQNRTKTSGYFCRRHKSITKAVLCNIQHFGIADGDMQLNIYRLRIVAFPFQQRSCERATILRYTNIAYLVFSRVHWLFRVNNISELLLQVLRKFTKNFRTVGVPSQDSKKAPP